MDQPKKYFFMKLIPPRASFAQDMSEEERKIMQEHVAYWKALMEKGVVVAFGPVFDPAGVYGVGIMEVDDENSIEEIKKNDPALKAGNKYESYPMMAITKQNS